MIIELDGPQHFQQISNWRAPKDQQEVDRYKMSVANLNGYSVVRLTQTDVFYDTFDWVGEIRDWLEKVKYRAEEEKEPVNVMISTEDHYTLEGFCIDTGGCYFVIK